MTEIIAKAYERFRRCWKILLWTDLVYNVVAFALLTPLVALLLRAVIATSTQSVLSDQDILFFFLTPLGCTGLIVVGALRLGIGGLELAAMMGVLAKSDETTVRTVEALRFAASNSVAVLRVTARIVVSLLIISIPFAAFIVGVYYVLLSSHDINYYLSAWPREFVLAIALASVAALVQAAVLVRLLTDWLFAIPIVLFEDVQASRSLVVSRQRAVGHRRLILVHFAVWLVGLFVVSTVATTLIIGVGRSVVPRLADSLTYVTISIGLFLLLGWCINVAIRLFAAATFAAGQFTLYRAVGGTQYHLPEQLRGSPTEATERMFQLTRMRLLAAMVIGLGVSAVMGVTTLNGIRLEDDVDVIAHRGASFAAPENTMAAVTQAIEDGADWVEIDVQETADGEVVVFHDSDFMKLSGVDLKIWDATVPELQNIDIGSWFDPRFKDQRVPTLAEVLSVCKDKAGVVIELKYYGHDQNLEQRVADIVEQQQMDGDIMVMSLKPDAVTKMKSLRPNWRVGFLMSVTAGGLDRLNPDFLAVNASFVDRNLIAASKRKDRDVWAWTVNEPVSMSNFIGMGVDGLITDKPDLARKVLQERAAMGPTERLILEVSELFGIEPAISKQ